MRVTTKDDLLAHYATKPMQLFLQIDCFTGCQEDSVLQGDALHGDARMVGPAQELMSTPGRDLPVRVLIHADAQREDVRRLLTNMLASLDDSFDVLVEMNEEALFRHAGIERSMLMPPGFYDHDDDDGGDDRPF